MRRESLSTPFADIRERSEVGLSEHYSPDQPYLERKFRTLKEEKQKERKKFNVTKPRAEKPRQAVSQAAIKSKFLISFSLRDSLTRSLRLCSFVLVFGSLNFGFEKTQPYAKKNGTAGYISPSCVSK